MLPKVLKNFNLFVNGHGYAGRVEEVALPKLTIKTEDFQLGGLDTPVQMDMGMERLECGLRLREYDPQMISMLGIARRPERLPTLKAEATSGSNSGPGADLTGAAITGLATGAFGSKKMYQSGSSADKAPWRFTLRGGLSDEQTNIVIPVVVQLAGGVTELDFGQWKAGESTALNIRLALCYYRLEIDTQERVEVDVDNQMRKINGV